MTVIDVRRLKAQKIYSGELRLDFVPEEGLLAIPYVGFSGPVVAALRYEIFEDDCVEVKGSITFTLEGACSRCLAQAKETFTGEVYGLFETPEGDGETYGYRNVVELGELMRDSLLFALPPRLLCGQCTNDEKNGEN